MAVHWTLVALLLGAPLATAHAADARRTLASTVARFVQFVTWPDAAFPSPQAPLVVAVLGDEKLARALQTTLSRDEMPHDRPVEIRTILAAKDARGAHLVFVSRGAKLLMPGVAAAVQGTAAITLSDMPGFLLAGGNVALVQESDRLGFDINLDATEKTGARISSRLLQVARSVLRAGM